MRILSLLLRYSITISVIVIVGGLIAREVILFWGTQQVRIAENKMELIAGARYRTDYDKQCKQKGGGPSGRGVRTVQLRFTSDTEYQVEVICDYFSNDPIIIESYKLPPFVTKVGGQSGFTWNPESTSGIVLEVFLRHTSLILEGEKFKMVQGKQNIGGTQPQATCTGFGYMCCMAETQIGVGDLLPQATDCPAQCYAVCEPRPTVLRFTSDPNPDLQTRTVQLPKGSPITFYFVVDPGKAGEADTQLDFGDGQSQNFSEREANYTYQYQCDQPECQFAAHLSLLDPTGRQSVSTGISTINIVIR